MSIEPMTVTAANRDPDRPTDRPTDCATDRAARGADPDTVAFYAAMDRLDDIIRANRDAHRHIVVACFPKSASTYLNRALAAVTGFRSYLLNTAGHDNERNIEPHSIPMFLAQDTVSQEHMRATIPNLRWLEAMRIRPVVLVRDIFDVIVSSRDHSMHERAVDGPHAHVPKAYLDWPAEDQYAFLVRMVVPWYLSFTASWMDASRTLPLLWITYDEVVNDTASTIQRILDHTGVEIGDASIEAALAAMSTDGTRFNRGVAGRGRTELTDEHRRAVLDLAAVYRGHYDFSMIGIRAAAPVAGNDPCTG